MSWLEALERRGREAMGLPVAAEPAQKIVPSIAQPRKPKPEIKSLWFQTAPARLPDYPGSAEPAFYSVADSVLTMHDENGASIGKPYRLGPDDDERRIAGRLAREAWETATGGGNFNRRLDYQRGSYA